MKTRKDKYWGKYREIILAVALFLVLDLSVLVLNFYISYQISEDALAINLAGRQRMLSQRITKSLLIAQNNVNQELPLAEPLAELKTTTDLFNATLTAFEQGGEVQGGAGKKVQLAAINLTAGQEIIEQAREIWNPFLAMTQPLLAGKPGNDALYQVDSLVRFALGNNLKLLDQMNKLTTVLELSANSKADTLRKIQTGGIFLALLNFAFILFKFIRRLRENDRKIEVAQNETGEILATVKEGLFLLDSNFLVGSQFSASLSKMLGIPISAGADFKEILRNILPANNYINACDYIELLFSAHIKENLLGDLNPLNQVEVTVRNKQGASEIRYLTLDFNRVLINGKTVHLLVTLFDVTNEVQLERALVNAKDEAKIEIEGLLSLLKIDPMLLTTFITQAELGLLEINDELRSVAGEINYRPLDYRKTVDSVFRKVHSFKGDAAILGLESFETLAQKFEISLNQLRGKHAINGEDLLTLPFYLEEILQRITMVKDMMAKLSSYYDAFNPALETDNFAGNLERLVQRIANDNHKQVKLITDLGLLSELPQQTRSKLKEVVVQLLRNAVVHGIEHADERMKSGKQVSGNIHVSLQATAAGEYEFTLLDDGRGLVLENIKNALRVSGKYTDVQLNEFSDKQILMKIFEPGFTTTQKADKHSGHGVGLDVVNKKIEQLGARMRIATQESVYTRFSILFPA
jgi:two-component system, chemotaxis family, sensor kinase CheA